jgi:membrane-bound serine protease (ClpP class)
MRAPILLLAAVLVAVVPAAAGPAILRITIDAPIQPVTAEYVVQSVERADREGAGLLILRINTPGGLDTSMRRIIEAVVNARTPVAAYVAPSGARAASAGFFIGVACDIFAMAPGTSTGAAHPVGISMFGQSMDETMAEKVTNDAVSYIKTLAEKRDRNVKMAEDAVRLSKSYTEREALDGGLINLVAKTDEDIVDHYDGRTIRRFDGREQTLSLRNEPIEEIPMTFRQKFLLVISDPNLAYILLMIGLLGLYFEFAHPGAILPGVLGGISLLLAVFAFQILPINYVGLALILLAIVLFILEVKVHSFGMLTLGGLAALIIGSLMLIKGPPSLRPGLKVVIPVAVGFSLIIVFLLTLVVRAHARRSDTGKEGMIGEIGTALTDLDPEGKVRVHGEIWAAESAEVIRSGQKVQVVEVLATLKIRVKKL